MASSSSNRHWPSLFKSKPCNAAHQWQHDLINHPSLCHKPSLITSGLGGEERSPEPKPRWNPKPEQIRILEAIFNSGMVNPPRDEIRKIRAQLQEYGQVGDANVFYWFQNRKSRSKHKQRQRQQSRAPSNLAAPSSSSSSSEKSTGSTDKILPAGSVSQKSTVSLPIPFVDQLLLPPVYNLQEELLSGVVSSVQEEQANSVGFVPGLWTDLMMGLDQGSKGNVNYHVGGVEVSKFAGMQNPNPNSNGSCVATSATTTVVPDASVAAVPVNEMQAVDGGGGGVTGRLTVLINGMGFEVVGPLNVRAAFGEGAVLIHSSGHPVLTDQWGFTLHPLQDGSSYYLI